MLNFSYEILHSGDNDSNQGITRAQPINITNTSTATYYPTSFSGELCSKDKAYLSIIITILPLWAIITTLIVFVLLTFHKNLRATKVYDNCTKNNAKYVYYVELRTGETSVAYLKRRTIISIDMFDENLNTLARIAIPGPVIFGKRSKPTVFIEDEKYPELRVTRFWLYRGSKLKKVTTIRITHSCIEPDAKIMVYGIEIRGDSLEDRLFFPVMSFISAYGSATKPNVCFDHEPLGAISAMGGSQTDSLSIHYHLSWVDVILLTFLLLSLIFYFSTFDLISNDFGDSSQASLKGILLGTICFIFITLLRVFFRFVIKQNYSLKIGTGKWSIIYYSFCSCLFLISLILWILTTVKAYKHLCPNTYVAWLVTIIVAAVLSVLLTVLSTFFIWIYQLINPKITEQYLFPDEQNPGQEGTTSKSHQLMNQQHQQQQYNAHQRNIQTPLRNGGWQTTTASPAPPIQYLSPHYHQPGVGGNLVYGQPITISPMMNTPSYKTLQTTYNVNFDPPQAQQNQQTTYNQQTTTPTTQTVGGGSGKASGGKKIGSNESTGSSYYNQLMKNRGGVKSISQYGELLRQKKAANKQAGLNK